VKLELGEALANRALIYPSLIKDVDNTFNCFQPSAPSCNPIKEEKSSYDTCLCRLLPECVAPRLLHAFSHSPPRYTSFSLASKPHNHDLLLPPAQHWSSHPHMSLSSSRLALASCGHHRVELPSSFRSDLVSPSHGHTTTQQCRFVHGLFHLVLHLNRVPTASSHFIGETQRPTTKV
jgi:hypothetical protein